MPRRRHFHGIDCGKPYAVCKLHAGFVVKPIRFLHSGCSKRGALGNFSRSFARRSSPYACCNCKMSQCIPHSRIHFGKPRAVFHRFREALANIGISKQKRCTVNHFRSLSAALSSLSELGFWEAGANMGFWISKCRAVVIFMAFIAGSPMPFVSCMLDSV